MRPVFIWEDEGHNFIIDEDAHFEQLSREYRAGHVMLTQNINNLYNRFGGGDSARVKVDAILSGLNTRIFHANGDLATNKWASELLGAHEKQIVETSSTPQQYHGSNPIQAIQHSIYGAFFGKPSVTTSTRTVREPIIHPHEFSTLACGGAQNGMIATAIMTQVGRTFKSGLPFAMVNFKQIIVSDEAIVNDESMASTKRQIIAEHQNKGR